MKKSYLAVFELVFFAFALFLFIPAAKSVPSPYGYSPQVFFVAAAMLISRFFAYRGGRSMVVCILESLIVVIMFVAHRIALNVATGHISSMWLP